MAQHRFSVGEFVDFDPRTAPAFKTSGPYRVTRVLPAEAIQFQRYQIKSDGEPFERTANEAEIVAVQVA